MALKPLMPALTAPATPPQCSPGPYKRRAASLSFTAPLPAPISPSPRPSNPLTERHLLPILHRRCPASSAPPEPRCFLSRVPHVSLSLLCPRRRASVHRSGRRTSSGERAAVPSVRATVGPRCTARPTLVHRACTQCTGFTVGK
jgi:hypothetical protein